jgi:hypothetical protein
MTPKPQETLKNVILGIVWLAIGYLFIAYIICWVQN